MTARQQVVMFCKQHGLNVNGSGGIPLLSNKSLAWMECFDNWQCALDYLKQAHVAHQDGARFPWAAV